MLIKEYRIPLPLTVDEYKIAQLYMIAKKSREETKGTGSGVEIMVNEPYTDGPGGSGQFTRKIYHVGSHLPGWFKSLLPKSALTVEEEAWNAYPYTKTRFKCPFVEKFSLEIETYYTPDGGHQDNVFNLTDSEKQNRVVDLIDVVKDLQDAYEDPEKEDPTVFVSEKTHRGPLTTDWLEEHWPKDGQNPKEFHSSGKAIMCAYKLCKVEFRYWGMQSKIERFIHDTALRRTMLKAHLQAWVWQDEWFGLTMEDIRAIEIETAELLKKTMRAAEGGYEPGYDVGEEGEVAAGSAVTPANSVPSGTTGGETPSNEQQQQQHQQQHPMRAEEMRATFNSIEYSEAEVPNIIPKSTERLPRRSVCLEIAGDDFRMRSPHLSIASPSDMHRSICSDEDDEFFDCRENLDDSSSLAKWSSMELTPYDQDNDNNITPNYITRTASSMQPSNENQQQNFRRVQSLREQPTSPPISLTIHPPHSALPQVSIHPHSYRRPVIDVAEYGSAPSEVYCPTTVFLLVFHGGSVLDPNLEISVRKSDVTTFRGAFESIMRAHYPSLVGHVVIKCVPCPGICSEALAVLSSLSPYSFDVNPSDGDDFGVSNDRLPVGTIPIIATSSPEYETNVTKAIQMANKVYQDFLDSEKGIGFCGQVCILGDSVGSILAYDALCRNVKRSASDGSVADADISPGTKAVNNGSEENESDRHHLSAPGGGRLNQTENCEQSERSSSTRFDFDVADFFAFGSPLGILLAYRKIQAACSSNYRSVPRPSVQQIYNLFHPTDPIGCRLEPLLSAPFSRVPPVNVPRYQTYPMGDGGCHLLIEFIQTNSSLFSETPANYLGNGSRPSLLARRYSEESIQSGVIDTQQLHTINILKPKWWGPRRIDYALYCPEGLSNFPAHCLPHLFHASYWESADVISFILRQLVRCYDGNAGSGLTVENNDLGNFTPNQPREKWIKKRTSVKIRNGAANHRANDVLVKEGMPQVLSARFSYGPLDMAALSGERVDIHIMKEPPAGDWIFVSTELTDKAGRLNVKMPLQHTMGYGIYPVRMLVRGDHTMLHMTLAVVPPATETVVFSIDGSFAASVSVTGKDPKVKPGAVDIVRHWQELGYIILYVTGRPDMQLQRVVSWLAQHNFPHGLVSFADGFSTDPLRHKADCLKQLVQEQDIIIHAAYGSSKDISVYASLGIRPEQIYIVGKPAKKQLGQATFLPDGYADHLAQLTSHGGSRPAQGNARMVIPKSTFGLPGQMPGLQRRRTQRAKRTTSFPLNSNQPLQAPPALGASGGSSMAPPAREAHPSGDSIGSFVSRQ